MVRGLAVAVATGLLGCVVAQPTDPNVQTFSRSSSYELEIKHDEFTGSSTAKTQVMRVGGGLSLMAVASEEQNGQKFVGLALLSSSKGWKYLRCNSMDWLADGQRVKAPEENHNGDVRSGGYVSEQVMQLPFDEGEFLKIATARQVRGRLCRTEFELKPDQVAHLRDLAEWMDLIRRSPASPSPAARARE